MPLAMLPIKSLQHCQDQMIWAIVYLQYKDTTYTSFNLSSYLQHRTDYYEGFQFLNSTKAGSTLALRSLKMAFE